MMQSIEELIVARGRSVDTGTFRSAMADMPGAVTVVTTWARNGRPSGATLSSVVSLSLDPPLLLACFDHKSKTLAAIVGKGQFLVHVLAHGQQELAMTFSGKAANKFSGVNWTVGASGLPRIEGCVVAVACELHQIVEAGDHKIVIGRVVEVERAGGRNPMVYARRKMVPFDGNGEN
jgi:flavin reductase (DIM6/NTAB) family NADH-FMN oxidoreductase RutF